MPVPITAIMCVRNEEGYLRTTLSHLVRNGVRLMIIDNDSTDGTRRILDEFGDSIDRYERLEWRGELDWTALLEAKARLAAQVSRGWVIHHDADEVLESHDPLESFADAVARIDATPANVINFDELVFLPIGTASVAGQDFHQLLRHYYFHSPRPLRLMRAFRANTNLSPAEGGHEIVGPRVVVHERNFVLRHYPFLDQEHARRKYCTRTFAAHDLSKGWHFNRIDLAPEDMEFPPVERLKTWTPGEPLDMSDPWPDHYWIERKARRS